MPGIVTLCDWIDVITYDIHGFWEQRTGLVAPFTTQPRDEEFENAGNVVSTKRCESTYLEPSLL